MADSLTLTYDGYHCLAITFPPTGKVLLNDGARIVCEAGSKLFLWAGADKLST